MADLTPYSSPWWIDRLSRELSGRAATLQKLDDYYTGAHPLVYAGDKFRNAFGRYFAGWSDNFCSLVVDAVDERLDVEGFRMGSDEEADKDAWRIWQANGLDADSQIAHLEALVKGVSYVLVWPDDEDPETPEITIQDALETIVASDPCGRERLAGWKSWKESDGTTFGTLYLPDRIEKYVQVGKTSGIAVDFKLGSASWARRQVDGETWPLANPFEVVPIVPLVNRPRLRLRGSSEIAEIIPLQNALNKLALDMFVASEYAAFKQRWVTGMEIPDDPDTGKPIEPFRAAVDRLFVAEDPNARFGEFESSDLGNYVKAMETVIQHIASISRTPSHYLLGQMGVFPSGEALRSVETGLVRKAQRRQRWFGESWEEVIRLAFVALDDPRGEVRDSETLWADAETRTEAEHVDAVVKMGSAPIEIPQQILWEQLGLSPQMIERIKELKADEVEPVELPAPLPMPGMMPDPNAPEVPDAMQMPAAPK
jgi:hypothetical protein